MGLDGKAKWEVGKENYPVPFRAKHSNRLFWPKFGFWALKENLVGVGSFAAVAMYLE